MFKNNNVKFLFAILLTAIISAGITFAFVQQDSGLSQAQEKSDDPFEKLFSTYDTLKGEFYQDTNQEKLVDGAIKGMIQSLDDPYSTYMDQDEAKGFNENISSSFEGIGAEVQESDGKIMIVSPIKGSPAEKAGLKPKDKILKVDDKSVEGMTVNEAVMLIRGEKGSKVQLVIERDGVGELDFNLTRDTIPLETVYTEVENGIGKVQITKFSETTGKELADALNELNKKEVKGLVLDLRQNPGGLLDQAIAMSDIFVPKGKTIMQIENKDGSKEVQKSQNDSAVNVPVVVVVDNGTASAAEIMAGALNQSAGIPIVGEKTFGKGTIQTAKSFEDGSSIKYTIAKWLTPDGSWIHKKGIEPQHKASLPAYANLPYLNPEKTLKQEDSSAEVKVAQQMLKALGYTNIKTDGFFDESTKKAVTEFQTKNNIEPTGTISGDTTIKMLELLQAQLKENDTQMDEAIKVLNEQM
ncbi:MULTISPECIES: S41 family peptidase [Bacillaceae]|uniref:S41 family peptidase n=1 Tax=Bacillaceae TaxID=186817 RepID=UPI001CD5F7B1|nr:MULTISPECIES: S41 family peptidase [Bacillaceae]